MPVHKGKDETGPYYQWGYHGKKYYYKSGDEKSKNNAKMKAHKQGVAIYASGWREFW